MRHSRLSLPTLVAGLAILSAVASSTLMAQSRVAPPSPVESAPLPPPPGAVSPAQTPPPPPAAVPETPPGPTPVQPAPALPGPVTPQPVQPAPSLPGPVEPQPVAPPPTLPSPGQPLPPVPPQQQTGAPNPNATLAGRPGDASDVDQILLVPKPVLALQGQSSWDQGFEKLVASFRILRDEASRAGLAIAGRPLTLFVETDDNGFRFEAMLPVDRVPESAGRPPLGNGVRASQSPAGPSLRFVHNAPYDDIDSTYETITAYLEAKNIVAKDAFLEEYVSDLRDPADPNLEINVYVQPR